MGFLAGPCASLQQLLKFFFHFCPQNIRRAILDRLHQDLHKKFVLESMAYIVHHRAGPPLRQRTCPQVV